MPENLKTLPKPLVWVLFLTVLTLATWLRLDEITAKPLHGDEANQAVKFGELLEKGDYRYDPVDHHGPTLYFLTLPVTFFAKVDSLAALSALHIRMVPFLFSMAGFILAITLRRYLKPMEWITFLAFAAVSPIMVYFSRYYIQEMLFIFFSFGLLISLLRYAHNEQYKAYWAIAIGIFSGLLHATKETCIIVFFSMASAGIVLFIIEKYIYQKTIQITTLVNKKHILSATLSALTISFLFYSSFLTHISGFIDSLTAYTHSVERSGGQGHEKPFYYYLQMLAYHRDGGYTFSEAPILVFALLGTLTVFTKKWQNPSKRQTLQFISLYSWILLITYSIIPYKTPWLALGFLHGMLIPAAVGAVASVRFFKDRKVQVIFIAAICFSLFYLGKQAYRGTHRLAADDRNPYVYSHTVTDILDFEKRIEDIATLHPEARKMEIKIISDEYWPIPWYLRKFQRVGYWSTKPDKEIFSSSNGNPIIITSDTFDETVRQAFPEIQTEYTPSMFGLRHGLILNLYIKKDLWDAYLKSKE